MIGVYIICGIIAVIALLLLQSIVLTVDYGDDLTLYVRFLFLKFKLIPQNNKDKKKKKNKKSKAKKDAHEIKKNVDKSLDIKGFADTFSEYREAIRPIIKALGSFCRRIRIYPLKIRAVLAGKDAADLAIDYGRLCAVFYPSLALLCEQFKIKNKNIYIGVDYVKPKFELNIYLKLRVRLCFALSLCIKSLWRLVCTKLKKSGIKTVNKTSNNSKTYERN